MPIIASAKKKLKQDSRRTKINRSVITAMKKAVKTARLSPTPKNVQAAYSTLDTAAKKRVIHKNKANRLKSRLSQIKKHPSKKE